MKSTSRRSLLLLLAALVVILVATKEDVAAFTPTCNHGVGHYSDSIALTGAPSSQCNPGILSCRIGTRYFEWDCVTQPDGSVQPVNVVGTNVFCYCNTPYYLKCC